MSAKQELVGRSLLTVCAPTALNGGLSKGPVRLRGPRLSASKVSPTKRCCEHQSVLRAVEAAQIDSK